MVPNAAIRLRRQPLRVASLLVAAALSLAAATISDAARVHLAAGIDANWRGAYDILVRPNGQQLNLEKTNGLVEPNFLGFTGAGGITRSQLEAIRRISGVELAAPVSVVGYLSYTQSAPIVYRTDAPSKPTLYRLDVSASTSDGLQEIVLQKQTARWLVGPGDFVSIDTAPRMASDVADTSAAAGGPGDSGFITLTFRQPLPTIVSPIIAVDPVAEQLLLGPTSSFLQALQDIPASKRSSLAAFNRELIPDAFAQMRSDFKHAAGTALLRPVVPIVASSTLYAPLDLQVSITQLGKTLEETPDYTAGGTAIEHAQELVGSGETAVGTVKLDATQRLRPFEPPSLELAWPGSTPTDVGYRLRTPNLRDVSLAQRPSYTIHQSSAGSQHPTFEIGAAGWVDANGFTHPASGEVGIQPAYRKHSSQPFALTGSFRAGDPYDQPFFFAPVGEFNLATLQRPTNPLNYVALGAYDPPGTTLVADPSGQAVAPMTLTPTLNPYGLIAVPPLAITDLAGAELLRGQAPIDAIRVRVAGLMGYDADGRSKVEQVAAQILALGLDIDVVAGSSPQPIELYVPSYFGTGANPQPLGYVEQAWTTLGAAAAVEQGLGSSDVLLLVLAIVAGAVFQGGVEIVGLTRRAEEVAVLRGLGWRRRRVLRLFAGEAMVGVSVIIVLTLGAWVTSKGAVAAPAVGAVLALVTVVSALVGGAAAWRLSRPWSAKTSGLRLRAPRGEGVRLTPARLAVRNRLARPIWTAMAAISLGLGAASVVVAVVVLQSVVLRVGPTLLSGALSEQLRPYQLAILGVTAVGLTALAMVALRLDVAQRAPDFRILWTLGWTSRRIRTVLAFERAIVGALGALIAALAAAALTAATGNEPSAFIVAIAAAAAASVVIWGGGFSRPAWQDSPR